MPIPQESDFPKGHPGRADFNAGSAAEREWKRTQVHVLGERDFPVDHPKALDTPGNTNTVQWLAGVDPAHPELEPFTGRTAEQAQAHREYYLEKAKEAQPTPGREPIEAPPPPPPESAALPTGQPGAR